MGKRTFRSTGAVLVVAGLVGWCVRAAGAQEPAAPAGPVSYWKFDEPTGGTTANNAVAGAPAGLYQGGVTVSNNVPPLITYPNPHSLDFNGTNAVLNVPNFGAFTAMSIACWVYRTGAGGGGRQSIVSYKETGGGFVLCLNENGGTEYTRIWLNQGGWQFKENTTTLPLNTWTHLAATYDNTNLRLYIDGVENMPTAGVAGNMTQPSAVTGIGARNSLDQNWFPGLIDDVRIYSRALSAAEVAVLAAGCPVPTGLTAANGTSQITLNWTAPAGAAPGYTYNVKRGTVSGTYATIATGVSGTSYVDSTVSPNVPYFYVVSAVSAAESGNSTEVMITPAAVTAFPNTGLQTNENGATASFNITFNSPAPAGGSTVTVTSNNTTQGGLVSSPTSPVPSAMFTIPVAAGFTGAIPITVTGVDDFVVNGNVPYTVSVTATGFAGLVIPDVQLTNLERDTLGILVSKSNLVTSTAGGQDTFAVLLNSKPAPGTAVTISLTSSNTTEGTVSPPSLLFSPANWNVPQQVTVTGVGGNLLYATQYYTISLVVQAGSDPAYFQLTNPPTGSPVQVSCANLHLEVPPSLPHVWGGSGGGGCGLLGAELALPLVLMGLLRRRRRA